jgi:hypothetical protein
MADDTRQNLIRAICFGIGIAIGLSVTRFVFDGSGAFAGAIGGMFGAMLGLLLFAIYVRIRG